jgi:hypothetical protein
MLCRNSILFVTADWLSENTINNFKESSQSHFQNCEVKTIMVELHPNETSADRSEVLQLLVRYKISRLPFMIRYKDNLNDGETFQDQTIPVNVGNITNTEVFTAAMKKYENFELLDSIKL